MVDGLRLNTSGFAFRHALLYLIAMLPLCSYVARSQVRSGIFSSIVHAHPVFSTLSSECIDMVSNDQTYQIENLPESVRDFQKTKVVSIPATYMSRSSSA
jgi:hypothetical protein